MGRSTSSEAYIASIQPGTPEITGRNVIIGGASGAGLAAGVEFGRRGEGVILTHSGAKKQLRIDSALESVRDAFRVARAGLPGDPELDVVAIGGDITRSVHQEQLLEVAQRWAGENGVLNSVILAAARGTKPTQLGGAAELDPEDAELTDEEYALKLNRDALVDVVKMLTEAETADGRPLLTEATVLYPTSTIAYQWNDKDAERPDFYKDVGPSKRAAFEALMGTTREELEKVDARLATAVMGLIDGTLVATKISRDMPEFLEREDVKATRIDKERAGYGMVEIISDPKFASGAVLAVLRDRIEELPA